jgi:hypothetical protein
MERKPPMSGRVVPHLLVPAARALGSLAVFALPFPLVALVVSAFLPAPAFGPARAWAGTEGTTGLNFLRLGVGARAAAMGDAFTSIAKDASAVYWNPAGLAAAAGTSATLMHNEYLQDVRHEYAGLGFRSGDHGFGFAVSGMYTNDLDGRDVQGNKTPDFGFYDLALSGAYGLSVREGFRVGATVKYLREQIDDETASGVAFDLGTQFDTGVAGLTLGAGVRNVGGKMKFVEDEFDLPMMLQGGASWGRPVGGTVGNLLLAADVLVPRDGDTSVRLGSELSYRDFSSISVGYRSSLDNENVSFGLGAWKNTFRVDYAYVPFSSDLGSAHRVSLSRHW